MNTAAPVVITIPAKPKAELQKIQRQLRVAAYCRVSTDSEEQMKSYEAQQNYYTDKIMGNRAWTMAGIFADEESGTSAKKRADFQRMIRQCKQKKIDLILTKSVTRFARNTVDCLHYIRALKELGIGILFEEVNLNTLEMDSELIVTILGAVAQGQSETTSHNVAWGHREAMREGKVHYQYSHLYGYEKGEDGNPKIIPEQAVIVRRIFDRCLAGDSLRTIADSLTKDGILTVRGCPEWTITAVRGILKNEKYCGDVLRQKTFVTDCISKKVRKNTGQLPMYLTQDRHEAIVSRDTFNSVQAELARRTGMRSPSKATASTGQARYSSKYALTERLVCGECSTLYRRCVWAKNGKSRAVWRCVSRLNYATKYCKAPTMDEESLHKGILAALNSAMSDKPKLVRQITSAMQMVLSPAPGQTISMADIERRLEELNEEMKRTLASGAASGDLAACSERFKFLTGEMSALKDKKESILRLQENNTNMSQRTAEAAKAMECIAPDIQEWDESLIRQLVDTVTVLSASRINVRLRGGVEIGQELNL